MKTLTIETTIKVYAYHELSTEERKLTESALEATYRSYAPYSNFHVGAAVLLENDVIVTGTNQENVAYPSGLCAERTALFYANSQYPDVPVKALAIVARDANDVAKHDIISPCGACRQVMVETEKRFGKPMRVLLCGAEEVYVAESASSLLPLSFDF
jgi:cytidine deaminase